MNSLYEQNEQVRAQVCTIANTYDVSAELLWQAYLDMCDANLEQDLQDIANELMLEENKGE